MLHYNDTQAAPQGSNGEGADSKHGEGAHIAHALVVATHILCCGLPAAFALFGATMGVLATGGVLPSLHNWLHGYEGVVLGVSALLVTVGGTAEWMRRRTRTTFPVLFAVSVACLFINATVVMSHWAFAPTAHAALTQPTQP